MTILAAVLAGRLAFLDCDGHQAAGGAGTAVGLVLRGYDMRGTTPLSVSGWPSQIACS